MPYCLSIVIVKLKDLVFEHQNLKKDQKFDIENVSPPPFANLFISLVNHAVPLASEVFDIQDAQLYLVLLRSSVPGHYRQIECKSASPI